MRTSLPTKLSYLLVLAIATSLASCRSKKSQDEASGGGSALSAAATAALEKADAADGATDKTVSKCLTCNLGMDGSAEHLTKVGDYSLHLCSAECQQEVDADPEKALAAIK